MKKILIPLLTLLAVTNIATAQEFYVKGAVGLAFPHAGQSVSVNGYPYSGSALYTAGNTTFSSFESKRISFAQGVPVTLGIGCFLTKNIGIELDMIVGASTKEHTAKNTFPIFTSGGGTLNLTQVSSIRVKNPIMAVPSIVIRSNKGGKAYAYMRAGVIIPVSMPLRESFSETYTHPASGARSRYTGAREAKTAFNLGINGALGVNLKVVDKVGVFAEAALQSMSLYLKESELTALNEDNGASVLNQVAPSSRKVTYENKSAVGGSEVSFALPFSSLGVNVGLTLEM